MTPFQDITLKDGQPTPAGDLAMELAYEKLTGGCWHKERMILDQGIAAIEKTKGTG